MIRKLLVTIVMLAGMSAAGHAITIDGKVDGISEGYTQQFTASFDVATFDGSPDATGTLFFDATGDTVTIGLVVPLTLVDRPQVGVLPFSGNTIQIMPDGAIVARWLRVGDRVLSVNAKGVFLWKTY